MDWVAESTRAIVEHDAMVPDSASSTNAADVSPRSSSPSTAGPKRDSFDQFFGSDYDPEKDPELDSLLGSLSFSSDIWPLDPFISGDAHGATSDNIDRD